MTSRFNPWKLLPVLILTATVLANVVLIRLATNTDDVLLRVDDRDAAPPATAPADDAD